MVSHSDGSFALHWAHVALARRSTEGRVLSDNSTGGSSLLHRHLLVETFEGIVTLKLLKLNGSVLIKELINRQVTSTDTDVDLVSVNSDGDSLGAELVNTIALTHEHNLQLLAVREVVNVLCKAFVNGVALDWDVDSNARLQVNDVLLKGLNLHHGGFQVEFTFLQRLEDHDLLFLGLHELSF